MAVTADYRPAYRILTYYCLRDQMSAPETRYLGVAVYDLIWSILALVVMTFGGLVYYFLTHGGLDPGPIATWLSGAASTCAVIVALGGQRVAARQREIDKAEKLEAAAYQAAAKVHELTRAAHYAHKRLRERIRVLQVRQQLGGDEAGVYYARPLRAVIQRGAAQLSDDEENLFARRGNYDELTALNKAMNSYKGFLLAASHHEKKFDQLLELARELTLENGRIKAIDWDMSDPNVVRSFTSASSTLGAMSNLAKRTAFLTKNSALPALSIIYSYIPNGTVPTAAVSKLVEEAALPFPLIPSQSVSVDSPNPNVGTSPSIKNRALVSFHALKAGVVGAWRWPR